tara:strand:- start:15 stop:827 length:813 start_codon:yes stop_codon:yes gene_type:complete
MKKLFENWRNFVNEQEKLVPGTMADVPASGISVGSDDDLMSGGGRGSSGERPPTPGKEKEELGPDTVTPSGYTLQELAGMWCSLWALQRSASHGDNRHYIKDKDGKYVLEGAKRVVAQTAKQSGIGPKAFLKIVKAHPDWTVANGLATNPYKFSQEEMAYFRKNIKGFDDYSMKMLMRRYTNIEAFINSGMPRREKRQNQFGVSLGEMRSLIMNANNTLKATRYTEFAIDGEKSLFEPSDASLTYGHFFSDPTPSDIAQPRGRRTGPVEN